MRRAARRIAGLFAMAAALGVPGAGIAAGKPAAARAMTDSVLVRIGREAITTGMVQRRIEELPEHLRGQFTTLEGRQRLLDRMVEERVWLLTALQHGVGARPDIQRQIDQQRRDLLVRTYINEVMAASPAPPDSEIRAYYDQHAADYKIPASVTISHIQVKTEVEARRLRQMARAGQDWAKLVARYSADTLTRARAGTLGPTTREGVLGHLGRQAAFAETAFVVGEGKIGGPIKTEFGWHVIRVDALKAESEREFDQVRGSIARQLGSKRSQDFYQSKLGDAKAALGVRADSSAIRSFVTRKRTARESFNDAQAAGPPAARIEAYRKVVEEHPDSDVSPQAAFMVGFIQSEELKDFAAAEKSFRDLLARYPKSELAASAKWMMEHMRSENAPEFMNLESDSSQAGAAGRPAASPAGDKGNKGVRGGTGKP